MRRVCFGFLCRGAEVRTCVKKVLNNRVKRGYSVVQNGQE